MRKTLYQKNFTLLKKFAPEILEDTPPIFSLQHIGRTDPRVRTYAERVGSNLVKIGTDWPINEEPACDPLFEVMFDNTLQIARVHYLAMENLMFQLMYNGPVFDDYECTFLSEETQRESAANDFLYEWLKGVARDRKNDPAYFQKVPTGDFPNAE